MIASYVEEQHKHWDHYLPEIQFALNTAVHESTGITPAKLSPQLCNPDAPAYVSAKQIASFQTLA